MQITNRALTSLLFLIVILCLAYTANAQVADNGLYDNTVGLELYPPGYTRFPPLNSVQVITTPDGFDNFDVGIDNAEQHLVANPNNPLQFFFGINRAGGGTAARRTEDGGLLWTRNDPPGVNSGDPWAAYDTYGNLYLQVLGSGQPVFRSTNNGATWAAGIPSVPGTDRNTLAVDQTTGPYSGYLYAGAWGTPAGSCQFARSTNFGATWISTLTTPNTTPGNMIAVGANVLGGNDISGGCVYFVSITGTNPAPTTYNFFRSTNGGATFTQMSSIDSVGYLGTLNTVNRLVINNARTRPYPMIAADNSFGPNRGRLYLVYATNLPAGNGNKPDIVIQYSTDQGATWSVRRRVNDNANPETTNEWFPAIWCDITTGRLYVKWYDMRNDLTNQRAWVYGTYSDDGGVTFAPNQKLSNTDFPYPGIPCAPNTNCYRGDYDAIVSTGNVALAVWTDFRNNTYQNMLSYFPDYAMLARANRDTLKNTDSTLAIISVPAVKLYTRSVRFSVTVSPPAPFVLTWVGRDSLTSYPDSVTLKIKTNNVPDGNYTVTITGRGPNGTPVHRRTIPIRVQFIPNSVAVLQPNGGEIWIQGQTKQIRWRHTGDVGSVRLDYSTNNGSTWSLINASVPAINGFLNWLVPATPSTQALVRASWVDSLTTVRDQSDAPFTIAAATPLINIANDSLRAVVAHGTNFGFDTLRISNTGTLALNWSTTGTAWANGFPPSGSVPADSTRQAPVRFSAAGLLGGTYRGNLTVSSNDAFRPTVLVPMRLTVVGTPVAATSRDTLNFGGVLVGRRDSLRIIIRNTGTDTLRTTSSILPIGVFTRLVSTFRIAPNDSGQMFVYFAPLDTFSYNATLSIVTNDPNPARDTLFVRLTGRGTSSTSVRLFTDTGIPEQYMLEQNYPNPFNPTTTIRFGIPNGSGNTHTTLLVFDAIGREVATLVNEQLAAGTYTAVFETGGLSSGMYFYRLSSGKFVETKKMQLLK